MLSQQGLLWILKKPLTKEVVLQVVILDMWVKASDVMKTKRAAEFNWHTTVSSYLHVSGSSQLPPGGPQWNPSDIFQKRINHAGKHSLTVFGSTVGKTIKLTIWNQQNMT